DQKIDPIARFEMVLTEAGILTEERIQQLRREVHTAVEAANRFAEAEPDPDPATATTHVFFEGELGLTYEASEPAGEPLVLVDAVNQALREEMQRDERVLV